MHLEESAMQSIKWDPNNFEDLLPNWHKYYEHLENFLNNNIKLTNSSLNNINRILADRNIQMDDSEDMKNKRKTAILSDWTNNPFERVNHSTNFEDYACSSDDTTLLYASGPIIKSETSGSKLVPKQINEIKKESLSHSNNQMSNKISSKFEPSVTPIISNFLADQRDHSFAESCISAGNSSADVTPSGTPQSSPYTVRKAMDSNNKVKAAKNDNNKTLSVNPKRWFYTGFFLNPDNAQHSEHKPIINDKPITKNLSFKNLSVSNFDINAVGPTSW